MPEWRRHHGPFKTIAKHLEAADTSHNIGHGHLEFGGVKVIVIEWSVHVVARHGSCFCDGALGFIPLRKQRHGDALDVLSNFLGV